MTFSSAFPLTLFLDLQSCSFSWYSVIMNSINFYWDAGKGLFIWLHTLMKIFVPSTNYEMFAQNYMEWNLFYVTAKRVHCDEELQGDPALNDHSHPQHFCSEQM